MNAVMPTMLSWVLGGNLGVFRNSSRAPLCHLCDKPKHFEEQATPLPIPSPHHVPTALADTLPTNHSPPANVVVQSNARWLTPLGRLNLNVTWITCMS